jgi:ArsR family transcriptional regulator, arsenate/arsenite/antimonite-responsive transcriptional repressor
MNSSDAVTALSAISQESRLELFRLLVKRGPDGYSPGDLTEKLGIPGPTLSFHLKALTHAGLVMARKESRFIYYSPNFDRVNALIGFLTEHCCSLSSTACDAGCVPAAPTAKQKTTRRRA